MIRTWVCVLVFLSGGAFAGPIGRSNVGGVAGYREEGWSIRVPVGWRLRQDDEIVFLGREGAAVVAMYLPKLNFEEHAKTTPPPRLTFPGGVVLEATSKWKRMDLPDKKALFFEADALNPKRGRAKGAGRVVAVFGSAGSWVGGVQLMGVGTDSDFRELAEAVSFQAPDFGSSAPKAYGVWCDEDGTRLVTIQDDGLVRLLKPGRTDTGPYAGFGSGQWQLHGFGTYHASGTSIRMRWKDPWVQERCDAGPAKGDFSELRCTDGTLRRCDP